MATSSAATNQNCMEIPSLSDSVLDFSSSPPLASTGKRSSSLLEEEQTLIPEDGEHVDALPESSEQNMLIKKIKLENDGKQSTRHLEEELILFAEDGEHVAALPESSEQKTLIKKVKLESDVCSKHALPYIFWCVEHTDLFCKKCVAELGVLNFKLELIEDSVPLMKTYLIQKVSDTKKLVQEDLDSLDEYHAKISNELKLVKLYLEDMKKLVQDLEECLKKIESRKCERMRNLEQSMQVEQKNSTIEMEADVPFVVESIVTLKKIDQPSDHPTLDESKSLMCTTACTYMNQKESKEGDAPSATDFVSALIDSAGLILDKSLQEIVNLSSQLEDEQHWIMNSLSCPAVLLAFTSNKQPSTLTVSVGEEKKESLPPMFIAAVASCARDCKVNLISKHSFLDPQDPRPDHEQMMQFLSNDSLSISRFTGYLDAAGMAVLPHTITRVSLALACADDVEALSMIRPCESLKYLCISIGRNLTVEDLRPLPNVHRFLFFFPYLNDDRVDTVRPFLEALCPQRRVGVVGFPKCQLTNVNVRRLCALLHGLTSSIYIEPIGDWQPNEEQKEFEEIHFKAAGFGLYWNMEKFYS